MDLSAGSRLAVSNIAAASIGRTVSAKSVHGTAITNIVTNDLTH